MKLITLDPRDALPLTDQIAEGLRSRIVQRALRPGTRLPSIRSFAQLHGVSPFTVTAAYERLVKGGLLVSRQGSGFYIQSRPRTSRRTHEPVQLENAQDTLWILRNILSEERPILQAGAGWLPAAWLDDGALRRALANLARAKDGSLFRYGEPHGHGGLRECIARALAANGIRAEARQIITTNGVSQAVDLVGRYYLHPGDTVLVDDPGYYSTFGHLKSLGATVIGVPRTAHGPDIAALEKLAAEYRPKLFSTMSVLHNPTGTSTDQASAHRVLQLASEYDFMVLENDSYGDFHPAQLARLATLDQLQRVIYVGGYSKTISPDLRVGYIASRADIAEDLVDLKLLTGLTTSQLAERLVCDIISGGEYAALLKRLQRRLEKSRVQVTEKLVECGLELFSAPEAGMFLLARFADGRDPAELATLAAAEGIILAPGHLFRPHHEPSPWLRFNVAFCDDPKLYRFLRTLRRRKRKTSRTAKSTS